MVRSADAGRRLHSRRATVMATAVAAVASIVLATTTFALSFTPTLVLVTEPAGVPMAVSNLATRGDNIAVTWTETISPGTVNQYSYMAWSTDGGQTFSDPLALNGGAGAVSARPAICGGYVWALTSIQTGPSAFGLGLDGQDLDGPTHTLGSFDSNFSTTTSNALNTGLVCAGSDRLAAIWSDPKTNPAHVMVGIRPLWPCVSNPGPSCDPGPSYTFDLGLHRYWESPYIAATKHSIYVAFMKDNGDLRFKRFSLSADGTVTPHRTKILLQSTAIQNPVLAASGSRVVLGYDDGTRSKVRISTDRGVSFGPATTLPLASGEPESGTQSVAVRGQRILVEISQGPCVRCYGIDFSIGYLSTDGGATWSTTSSHPHARQLGAFFIRGGVVKIAEVWDDEQTGATYRKVYFHVGTF